MRRLRLRGWLRIVDKRRRARCLNGKRQDMPQWRRFRLLCWTVGPASSSSEREVPPTRPLMWHRQTCRPWRLLLSRRSCRRRR